MCGFIGIINKNGGVVESDILNKMASTIHHVGPMKMEYCSKAQLDFFIKDFQLLTWLLAVNLCHLKTVLLFIMEKFIII